jgi:hypothetical protein
MNLCGKPIYIYITYVIQGNYCIKFYKYFLFFQTTYNIRIMCYRDKTRM